MPICWQHRKNWPTQFTRHVHQVVQVMRRSQLHRSQGQKARRCQQEPRLPCRGAAATGTFSAAQIQAGFGGTAEKTLEEMKAMRKSTEKNEAAAKEVRDALLKIPFSLTTLMPRFG